MGIPEFLDSGHKSWTLGSGRWTRDAKLWTLDAVHWTLDAGFNDGLHIVLSELACFSKTKQYFHYSTNRKKDRQFLYYWKIPNKETKHNEPVIGVLKKNYSLDQNLPKKQQLWRFLVVITKDVVLWPKTLLILCCERFSDYPNNHRKPSSRIWTWTHLFPSHLLVLQI